MNLPSSYWDIVLKGLPVQVIQSIYAKGTKQRYPAKTVLFSEGLGATKIMVILAGRVRSFYYTAQGRESTVLLSKEGVILGLVALLTKQPVSISISALTSVEVLEFQADDYRSMLEQIPLFAMRNAEVLAYVHGAHTHRTRLNLDPADIRLVKILLQLCPDHARGPALISGYTHESIAAMADVSRSWANQKLQQLQRDGLILLHRSKIEVLDTATLRAYLMAE